MGFEALSFLFQNLCSSQSWSHRGSRNAQTQENGNQPFLAFPESIEPHGNESKSLPGRAQGGHSQDTAEVTSLPRADGMWGHHHLPHPGKHQRFQSRFILNWKKKIYSFSSQHENCCPDSSDQELLTSPVKRYQNC